MPAMIEVAAQLLRQSGHTIALTGAGISTPSGIPDFRSSRSGVWNFADPFDVASIWAFHDRPDAFYRWIRPLAQRIRDAQPNPAHRALAALEASGGLRAVITQNVDSLHQQAGSRRILELHGSIRTATCIDCPYHASAEALWSAVLQEERPAPCPVCGGWLKPDVVLFGEPLPQESLVAAQQEALACDVMLVVGTSLEVMPAADLPLLAKRRGARLILVNRDPTPYDHLMDIVIQADVAETLSQLAGAVLTDAETPSVAGG